MSTKLTTVTQIADFIKQKRTEQGISMYKLANDSGINRSSLSRIETGTSPPSSETLLKILNALRCELFCTSV
jgi:transcriptional regulator with XRE-family HTH domain